MPPNPSITRETTNMVQLTEAEYIIVLMRNTMILVRKRMILVTKERRCKAKFVCHSSSKSKTAEAAFHCSEGGSPFLREPIQGP